MFQIEVAAIGSLVSIVDAAVEAKCPTADSPRTMSQPMKLISPYASPERARAINLEQFAFRAMPSRSRTIAPGSRTPSFRAMSTTTAAGNSPHSPRQLRPTTKKSFVKRATSSLPTFNINDEDWGRLHLCFSCGVKWSRRKTVNKKKVHIEKCIRLNGIAQVETLIRRTLEGAPAQGHEGHPPEPPETGTLLHDHVSAGDMRKNRSKRPTDIVSSVRDLASAKEAIRKRADEFLSAQAVPSHTQVLRPGALGQLSLMFGSRIAGAATPTDSVWQSTQHLPQSHLGTIPAPAKNTLAFKDAAIPPTQRLPPSRLSRPHLSLSTEDDF